jgi:hypothetical protein
MKEIKQEYIINPYLKKLLIIYFFLALLFTFIDKIIKNYLYPYYFKIINYKIKFFRNNI